MQGKELFTQMIELPNGERIEQCFIQEISTGLVFSLDASYVEQEVDLIQSPYKNGEVSLE